MTRRSCPACGAVVPKRVGRCPSCRAWLGRRLIAVGLAGAFVAVVSAGAFIRGRGFWGAAGPRVGVQITPGITLRSLNKRGTDALATIDNPNPVPVDVTVRVRGFDTADHRVIERTIGPFRGVPAGGIRPIETYLDATPLKSVTFEAIAVKPVGSNR